MIERVCFVRKRARTGLGQGWSQQEDGGLLGRGALGWQLCAARELPVVSERQITFCCSIGRAVVVLATQAALGHFAECRVWGGGHQGRPLVPPTKEDTVDFRDLRIFLEKIENK